MYRVDANKSDDEHAPDWRTELYSNSLAECEAKAKELRESGRFSEVQVMCGMLPVVSLPPT